MKTNFKHIEGTGKPIKVVAPETAGGYITHGKEYKVIRTDRKWGKHGWGIYLKSNENKMVEALEKYCPHLNGGNWIVTERES